MNKIFLLACMMAVAMAACDSSECKACKGEKFDNKKGEADDKKCKKALKNAKTKLKCKAYRHCVLKEQAALEAARAKVAELCVKERRFCRDTNPLCRSWRANGECRRNADFMLTTCPLSCCPICNGDVNLGNNKCPKKKSDRNLCNRNSRNPRHTCDAWAKKGECTKKSAKDFMIPNCMESCCSVCQKDENGCPTTRSKCVNSYGEKDANRKCRNWAINGECQRNRDWMFKNCEKECCPACSPRSPVRQPVAPRAFGGYGAGLPYGAFRG